MVVRSSVIPRGAAGNLVQTGLGSKCRPWSVHAGSVPALESLIAAPGLRTVAACSTRVSNCQPPDQRGAREPPPQARSFQ